MAIRYKCPKCGAPGFYSFLEVPVTFDDTCQIISKGDVTEEVHAATPARCRQYGDECFSGVVDDFEYKDGPEPSVTREDLMKAIARVTDEMRGMHKTFEKFFGSK